jgi:hypothetical protein
MEWDAAFDLEISARGGQDGASGKTTLVITLRSLASKKAAEIFGIPIDDHRKSLSRSGI